MTFKSYTTKVFLAIIPILLIAGYFERYLFLIPQYFSTNNIYASEINIDYTSNIELKKFEDIPLTLIDRIKSMKVSSSKVRNVNRYLAGRNSPLASKAKFLVQTANYYHIDYDLVAAISIIESSGGIHTYRPYNAWGWGGANGAFTFRNWEEAIITVSRGLSNYYARGANTPSRIAPAYNPHTPNEWARKVTSVMSQM